MKFLHTSHILHQSFGLIFRKSLPVHCDQYLSLLTVEITHLGEGCVAIPIAIGAVPFVEFVTLEVTVVISMASTSTNGAAGRGPAVVHVVAKPPASATLPGLGYVFFDFYSFKANSDY